MKKKKQFILLFCLLGSFFLQGQVKTWTLENCIDYALGNDLYLKEVALNQDFYQQEIKAAYGNLLPNAGIYADHQYNFGSVIDPTTNSRVSSDIQANSIQFSSKIDLFNWGNFIKIKSAKLQKEKALYDLEVQKNELIIKIVQAFNHIQFDKEQLILIQNQLINTELTLNRIETEVNLGNKPKSDFYEMVAQKTSEEQMRNQVENSLKISENRLLNLLQLKEYMEFSSSELADLALPAESLDNLYQLGVLNRPELKSAEIQKEISEKFIQEKRSHYLPTISGNYSLSSFYVDTETAALGDQFKNNRNHYIGISLNLPLFNRLQTQTAVQQAKIDWEKANLQLEQQKQAYFNALRDAYTQTQNAYGRWEAAELNLEAQEISFAKTEEKFKQGMVDAFAYFAAKNNLFGAQTAVLQAKYTYHYENLLLNWYVTNELNP
jgi:outer membrane protein